MVLKGVGGDGVRDAFDQMLRMYEILKEQIKIYFKKSRLRV